jgi:hypothetical protein
MELNIPLIWLGIIIRFIALYLLVIYVLPIQIKEAKIPNGISRLRKMLLIIGIALVISIFVNTIFNINRIIVGETPFVEIVSVINSISNLLIALMLYLIYQKR